MTSDEQRPQAASNVANDYDRLAEAYVEHIYHELAHKPFDRELLASFASKVSEGRVCDVGCGPGHVARYLHELGCDVFGVDLSRRMVELASELNPGIEFVVGDLRSLPVDDGSLAGMVCFYSLIHLAVDELTPALRKLWEKLSPGGTLLVAVHEGLETRAPGELWGVRNDLRFNFFSREQIENALDESSFCIEELRQREPYPEIEAATNRLYVVASAKKTR